MTQSNLVSLDLRPRSRQQAKAPLRGVVATCALALSASLADDTAAAPNSSDNGNGQRSSDVAMQQDWEMAAPGLEWRYPVVQARRGIVLRSGARVLLADAAQWSSSRQLYATGRIRLLIGSTRADGTTRTNDTRIHLAADSIGLDQSLSIGEAWNVSCTIITQFGRIRLTAKRMAMGEEAWVFEDVTLDQGLGAVGLFSCDRITLHRRAEPAEDRRGIERILSGITMHGATLHAAGVPVMYLPWAHRDFIYDYPWTRYRGGISSRHGWFLQSEIGTDLPTVAGVSTNIRGRFDMYSHNGEAFGVSGTAVHRATGGRLEATYYHMPNEEVRQSNNGPVIEERPATFVQAEYQQPIDGYGAVSGFWATVPKGVDDPSQPGVWQAPDGRFRSDFNDDWLKYHPFARRGAQASFTLPFGSVSALTQFNPNELSQETEIPARVSASVPHLSIAGPTYVFGQAFVDSVERDDSSSAIAEEQTATRLGTTVGGGIGGWLPWGLGLDLRSGIRYRAHQDGELDGIEQEYQEQSVPFTSLQSRLRFVYESDSLSSRLLPQIGYTWLGGETTPTQIYDFEDGFDDLASDRQFITTNLSGSLQWTNKPQLFTGRAQARWGVRDHDRRFTDADGEEKSARIH